MKILYLTYILLFLGKAEICAFILRFLFHKSHISQHRLACYNLSMYSILAPNHKLKLRYVSVAKRRDLILYESFKNDNIVESFKQSSGHFQQ